MEGLVLLGELLLWVLVATVDIAAAVRSRRFLPPAYYRHGARWILLPILAMLLTILAIGLMTPEPRYAVPVLLLVSAPAIIAGIRACAWSLDSWPASPWRATLVGAGVSIVATPMSIGVAAGFVLGSGLALEILLG